MRAVVVGGGPIGIFTGMALARRGHHVVLVDRDPGPDPEGRWQRRGVMQFMHPHYLRPAVREAFLAELPDVWQRILAAGGEERQIAAAPPGVLGLACRRSVWESTLRLAASDEPRLALCIGHAEDIVVEGGTARAVVVDGRRIEADVVVVATGRSSRLGSELRAEAEGGSCSMSYVSRMYRGRAGQGCGLGSPRYALGDGYLTVVLPQDDDTLTTLIVRPSDDAALAGVRVTAGFDAAVRAIPNLAEWTDPERFDPITDVLVGGGLTNTYTAQGPERGVPAPRGLFFVGDSVCTTNPQAGRGVALGLGQARRLLTLLDDPALTMDERSAALQAWCDENVRPWFVDHVEWDATLLQFFADGALPSEGPIPSWVICEAGRDDTAMAPYVAMYQGMAIMPEQLRAVEENARDRLRSGWRPVLEGPSSMDLADIVNRAAAAAAHPVLAPA